MIHNIIIFGASGIVLYERTFNNGTAGVRPTMLGNLMVAMHTFSQQTTGMAVSFIELSKISVAMKWKHKVGCCLIYDCSDGKLLGQLLCTEILDAFTQDYPASLGFAGLNSTTEYKGFNKRLPNIIYYSMRPIVVHLETIPGIQKAIIINTPHEVIDSQHDHQKDFSILSETDSLVELASELMLHGNDFFQNLTIDTEGDDRLSMWKIRDNMFLLCILDKSVAVDAFSDGIETSLDMIEEIVIVHEEINISLSKL